MFHLKSARRFTNTNVVQYMKLHMKQYIKTNVLQPTIPNVRLPTVIMEVKIVNKWRSNFVIRLCEFLELRLRYDKNLLNF